MRVVMLLFVVLSSIATLFCVSVSVCVRLCTPVCEVCVYGGMNYPSVGHFAMLSLGRQGWGHFGFEVGLG